MSDEENTTNEDVELVTIRKEIEKFTKSIEHEKINLRLTKERYEKQHDYLILLQNKGKPGAKEKSSSSLPLGSNLKSLVRGSMEFVQRESANKEAQLQGLIDEINAIVEENKLLKLDIQEIRKDKLTLLNSVDLFQQKINKSKQEFGLMYTKNKHDKNDPEGLVSKVII